MASSSYYHDSRSLKYKSDYSTRSQSVIDRVNVLFNSFQHNPSIPDFVVINDLWPRFPIINSR